MDPQAPLKKTALILDDDAVSRVILSNVVHALGYEVLEARTGQQASDMLSESTPELVLVDGLLPDTDGATWIRKERRRLKGEVVFASSFWKDMASWKELTGELKVSAVLHKPFVIPELRARLAAIAGIAVH